MEHNITDSQIQEVTLSDGSKVYNVVCETFIFRCTTLSAAAGLFAMIDHGDFEIECFCQNGN
jgi:hypothetical protein